MKPVSKKPFSYKSSSNIPELLLDLNCSLCITTYQAGKLILIGPRNRDQLAQYPISFRKPMGVAIQGPKMAVASENDVTVFRNSPGLSRGFPQKEGVHDAVFVPRATYYTGAIDIHDLEWGAGALWAVNTAFSCLVKIDAEFSFTPVWKPPFISKILPNDRCHLNGLAMQAGKPKFVTALGTGDTPQSWRENIVNGGVLIDVDSGENVLRDLAMPHSPRIYNNKLYALLSATGELICVDPVKGSFDVVIKLDAFLRGMVIYNDFAFIGTSTLRSKSSTFDKLELEIKAQHAGVTIVHLPSVSVVGQFTYTSSVKEIYDVQLLPGVVHPMLLSRHVDEHKQSISFPGRAFWRRKRKKQ